MSLDTKKPFKLYLRLIDLIERLIWGFSLVLFFALVMIVVGGVFSRQLGLGVPAWYGEIQRYLIMWVLLPLSGPLVYRNMHFYVNSFAKVTNKRIRYYAKLLKLVPILFVAVILTNWGLEYVLTSGMSSTARSMNFQMAWVYLVLPVTGVSLILFTIARAIVIITPDGFQNESSIINDIEIENTQIKDKNDENKRWKNMERDQ